MEMAPRECGRGVLFIFSGAFTTLAVQAGDGFKSQDAVMECGKSSRTREALSGARAHAFPGSTFSSGLNMAGAGAESRTPPGHRVAAERSATGEHVYRVFMAVVRFGIEEGISVS